MANKMSKFCPENCEYLTVNEEQQNRQKQDGFEQGMHICLRFHKQVFHWQYHPKLNRLEECLEHEYKTEGD